MHRNKLPYSYDWSEGSKLGIEHSRDKDGKDKGKGPWGQLYVKKTKNSLAALQEAYARKGEWLAQLQALRAALPAAGFMQQPVRADAAAPAAEEVRDTGHAGRLQRSARWTQHSMLECMHEGGVYRRKALVLLCRTWQQLRRRCGQGQLPRGRLRRMLMHLQGHRSSCSQGWQQRARSPADRASIV